MWRNPHLSDSCYATPSNSDIVSSNHPVPFGREGRVAHPYTPPFSSNPCHRPASRRQPIVFLPRSATLDNGEHLCRLTLQLDRRGPRTKHPQITPKARIQNPILSILSYLSRSIIFSWNWLDWHCTAKRYCPRGFDTSRAKC